MRQQFWFKAIGNRQEATRISHESLLIAIVIPIIFRSATVSVASREQSLTTREQDAPTLSLMVFVWNDYSYSSGSMVLLNP